MTRGGLVWVLYNGTMLERVILYWRMTRPGFLVLTLCASLLGLATAVADDARVRWPIALATVLLACLAHAAGNVWNDYCDAKNGADAANRDGLYPFTGGARLIQQGRVSVAATARWGLTLMALLAAAGLWLSAGLGTLAPNLIGLGAAGILLAWAYSAAPVALMSRGLGEAAVAVAWGLIVVGVDGVQRGHFAVASCAAAWGMGLLVANVLLINGVPDARADAQAGKRTLAVRLGVVGVARAYLALALAAYAGLALLVSIGRLHIGALAGLAALPVSLAAAQQLRRYARASERQPIPGTGGLRAPIILTIVAANLYALAAAGGLALVR